MNEKQWLEFRQSGIGASEVAACLHSNKWATIGEVYESKRTPILYWEDSEDMYWGRELEDRIAKEYTRRTGLELEDPGRTASKRHSKRDWIFATPDRLIQTPHSGIGMLECKFVDSKFDEEWETHAPIYYIMQLQTQMSVWGKNWGCIAGLVGKSFRMYYYRRDKRWMNEAYRLLKRFWDTTKSGDYKDHYSRDYLLKAGRLRDTLRHRLDALHFQNPNSIRLQSVT